jgi:ADP-ribose pyrophosphatase YjhB (NUDIX family)
VASDTPHIRVAARAIIVRDGMLLVQYYEEHGERWCTTPGGGVERGERLDEGLRREISEELEIEIEVGPLRYIRELRGSTGVKLLGGLSPDFHQLEHFFEVRNFRGEPRDGAIRDNYATHIGWIPLGELAQHQFFPGPLCERLAADHRAAYPFGAVYLGDA